MAGNIIGDGCRWMVETNFYITNQIANETCKKYEYDFLTQIRAIH